MKPEYTNLKLIIETPTQDAWDKVTEFFGLDWSAKGFSYNRYAPFTCIRVGKNSLGMTEYSAAYREYFVTDHFNGFDRLTYPEFEARFLNQTKTMSKTLDEIKDEVSIDLEKVTYKNLKISDADEIVTAISTRFAAEQTAQMKADILELRKALKYTVAGEVGAIKFAGDTLKHTAHYTDV